MKDPGKRVPEKFKKGCEILQKKTRRFRGGFSIIISSCQES
jgi:hypothetical protein